MFISRITALLATLALATAVETLPELVREQKHHHQQQQQEETTNGSGCSGVKCAGRIQPVSEVNLDAYAGRWFQVYANNIVKYTFELGGVCVTADYGILPDGEGVSVHNAQNILRPNGTTTTIEGRAFARNASQPGKLTVEFTNIPFPGSYWIVKLGPEENGEYQYSVVTDAFGITLFVLARDVAAFERDYEEEVLAFVEPLFTGWLTKPRATVQGPDCVYSPVPEAEESTSSLPVMDEMMQDVLVQRHMLRGEQGGHN